MKRILVISFSDIEFDARVTRQITWLQEISEITCLCFAPNPNLNNIDWKIIQQTPLLPHRKILLAVTLFLRFYKLAYRIQHNYRKQVKDLKLEQFDWVFANDIESLPLAFQIKARTSTKIYFDAHEYAPRHFEDKLWWKLLFAPWYNHLCKNLIPKVNVMTTVSNGLAEEYQRNFGIKPHIITNATKYHELQTTEVNSPIKLIHHGIINKSRKIENMLRVMEILGKDYELDLILMLPEYASKDTQSYFMELSSQIEKIENVKLIGAMSNKEIVPFINKYDIGLFLLEPVNFNYTHALPNKLFDFIQARLAIAIGPSVEMAHYVKKYNLGFVSSSFEPEDLAQEIISAENYDIRRFKENSHSIAYELSEEANRTLVQSLIN